MAATRKYPIELRERAVRLYRESDPKPVIAQLARQLNVHQRPCATGSARMRPTVASATIARRRR